MVAENIYKTAFPLHHELPKYMHMPFRLNNCPPTFQRAVNFICELVEHQHALVHIDDITTFPKALKDHLKLIDGGLRYLIETRIVFKLEKCHVRD